MVSGGKMIISDCTKSEINVFFRKISEYLQEKKVEWVKYADLGCKVVRIISYSKEFLPHLENQLTYVLRDNVDNYDDTLIIWSEENITAAINYIPYFNPAKNLKLRINLLTSKNKECDIQVIDKEL